MTEIDRRALLGVAGAGLALASCNKGNGTKDIGQARTKSVCEVYGQSVTDNAPKTLGNVKDFKPSGFRALYIRFDPVVGLIVRQGYQDIGNVNSSDKASVSDAARVFLERIQKNSASDNFKEDIDFIHLGKQQFVLIFVDNKEDFIKFAEKYAQDSENEYVIRFGAISGSNPQFRVRENHAFFNLREIRFSSKTPLENNAAYIMEFWNTDENGNDIKANTSNPNTHYRYSMNIQLKMVSKASNGTVSWVPVVVDPDTGNMGGDP